MPEAHEFERWSDARAYDGTVTILQPQLRPLWNGWSAHELLAVLAGEPRPEGYAIIRDAWKRETEAFWIDAVREGVVRGSGSPPVEVSVMAGLAERLPPALPAGDTLTALFRPDPWLRDGRYANNGWLQELPRPLTSLTWDNAALIAPATARRLGVGNGQVVELETSAGKVRAPVWVMQGHAPDCVTLPSALAVRWRGGSVRAWGLTLTGCVRWLGYGRRRGCNCGRR